MSINYQMFPLVNLKSGETEFHAKVVNGQTIGTKQLAHEIEHATSLTKADVKAALNALSEAIKEHLKEGDSVHIEGLGYFKPSLKCTKKMTREKASGKFIEVRSINFRPEREMVNEMKHCTIVRSALQTPTAQLTDEELEALVLHHFESNTYLRRADLQSIAHISKKTACVRLLELVEKGTLRREGPRNAPVYVMNG